MRTNLPCLKEIALALEELVEDDVDYARENSAPLGENEVLLGISLGDKLENLLEGGRAYVLLGQLYRQCQEIMDGKTSLPAEIDRDAFLRTLVSKMDLCERLYGLCICVLAEEQDIEIPKNLTVGVLFYEGQFRATAILEEEYEEEGDPEIIFTPEISKKSLLN